MLSRSTSDSAWNVKYLLVVQVFYNPQTILLTCSKKFCLTKKNNFNFNQIIQNITNNMNRRNMNNKRNHQSGYFWTKTFAKTFISWKITIRKFLISRARDDITISAVMKKSLVYRCLTSDSFQTDALSLASDWLTFEKQRLHSHFEFY